MKAKTQFERLKVRFHYENRSNHDNFFFLYEILLIVKMQGRML